MNITFPRAMIFFAVGALIVGGLLLGTTNQAEAAWGRRSTPGDLFYNYYSPPVGYGSVGAQLYLCPRPAPPLVGYTYVTYPPLMPHEFLYKHRRVYTTKHLDAPRTRTRVRWW